MTDRAEKPIWSGSFTKVGRLNNNPYYLDGDHRVNLCSKKTCSVLGFTSECPYRLWVSIFRRPGPKRYKLELDKARPREWIDGNRVVLGSYTWLRLLGVLRLKSVCYFEVEYE